MPIRKTAWDNLFNFIPEFPFLKIENEAQGRQAISLYIKQGFQPILSNGSDESTAI
jgi:hypothetical protein